MGKSKFIKLVGREPTQDDLERVNCLDAGKVGHSQCGWCHIHNSPRFECGCLRFGKRNKRKDI